ncbi:MAG: type II toxin-antitoxin system VapC family toxin [Armatimonadetes bacterium]|nr:type II toxin-antitoxin system VapC family toxin [Armatimonadota bacterium]
MSGRFLLDSNIIIAHFANDPAVVARIADADEILVPVIALGELMFGAFKSTRSEENVARIREFRDSVAVLPVTAATADEYGRLKDELRAKGRPIPENDIWIAALARQHRLTLVSRDREHFCVVDGLSLESW